MLPLIPLLAILSGPDPEHLTPRYSLVVTATAYNSLPGQTQGEPRIAAWGDRLRPGVKAIAVSRDLLSLGLTRGMRVEIEGLPGEYLVLDKMASRWKRRIDLYMGEDLQAARAWGKRQLEIRWSPDPLDLELEPHYPVREAEQRAYP